MGQKVNGFDGFYEIMLIVLIYKILNNLNFVLIFFFKCVLFYYYNVS